MPLLHKYALGQQYVTWHNNPFFQLQFKYDISFCELFYLGLG